MYTVEKLDCGLDLMRIPMEGLESITSMVMVNAGSRYEEAADFGVAHFLEHMVFKGTKKYPTNKILTEKVDSIGAIFNAFTSEEMTAFYLRAAAKDFDFTLDVLGQLTTQMLLDPEEIERERGVILEEKHMYEDQPDAYNAQEFAKMMLDGSGLGHDIVGTDETIKNIKQETFRRFIDRWYFPENMLLVVAGQRKAVMAKDLADKVIQAFRFVKSKNRGSQREMWTEDFKYGPRLNLIDRKTEQSHFMMAWPAITRFDERRYALSLLKTILGGNMSSRLFSEVRERRGLCYYVLASSEDFCDAGYFGAASGVNPGKLTEAIKVTLGEFQAIAAGDKPITLEELQRAKDFRCGQMTLAAEGVYNLAMSYGSDYLFKKEVLTVAQSLEKIQAVTLDEVNQIARELIKPGELRLGVIGKMTRTQKKEIEELITSN